MLYTIVLTADRNVKDKPIDQVRREIFDNLVEVLKQRGYILRDIVKIDAGFLNDISTDDITIIVYFKADKINDYNDTYTVHYNGAEISHEIE